MKLQALEADDIDLLSDDAEDKFNNPDNESPEELDDDNDDNIDDEDSENDSDFDNTEDNEESIQDRELKRNIFNKMVYLYQTVAGQLDTLLGSNRMSNTSNENFSSIIKKFSLLKNIVFKFITEPLYRDAGYQEYTRWYVASNELHNLCLELLISYFKNNKDTKKPTNK